MRKLRQTVMKAHKQRMGKIGAMGSAGMPTPEDGSASALIGAPPNDGVPPPFKEGGRVEGKKPAHRADKPHRAHGGRIKKGDTHVNVMIGSKPNATGTSMPTPDMPTTALPSGPPPSPMPSMAPPMPPPGAGPGIQPGRMPPTGMSPIVRKNGGGVHMRGGAGSGVERNHRAKRGSE